MKTRGIRSHLFQVLLLSIVPVGLFAGALLFFHWKAQEKERERSQIESARLIATAVDNGAQTLLVVEDNADERESLRIALELKGQRVLLAADAGEARAEYDGAILLVALTGYGGEVEERRAREAGFDRHFTKPLDVAALLQEIEALLGARRVAVLPRVA